MPSSQSRAANGNRRRPAFYAQTQSGWLFTASQTPGVTGTPRNHSVWTWPKYLSFCMASPHLLSSLVSHLHPPPPPWLWLPASPTLPPFQFLESTGSSRIAMLFLPLGMLFQAPVSLLQSSPLQVELPTTAPSETGSCHSLPQPLPGVVPLYWCHVISSISQGLSWPTLPPTPCAQRGDHGVWRTVGARSECPHKSTNPALYYRC